MSDARTIEAVAGGEAPPVQTETAAAPRASGIQLLTWKCRLNPERRQHRALEAILEQQRQLYNACLEERIEAYRKTAAQAIGQIRRDREIGLVRITDEAGTVHLRRRSDIDPESLATIVRDENAILAGLKRVGRSPTDVEQSRSLTQIRAADPAFAGVQRRIQRATLQKIDRAYKAFFRRAAAGAGAASGFPRFKGRDFFNGFAFDAFAQIKLRDGGLRFLGMPGKLRVHLDRPLPEVVDPETGETAPDIRNVWFKRDGGRWFVGFQVAAPIRTSRQGLGTGAIGCDWGTSVLAALSSGETVPNPRPGEVYADALARAQRAVGRKKKGSKRRLKARRHLQAIARKIANRRRNHLDKVSARLVRHWQTVAVEKIDVKDMMNAERPGEELPADIKRRRNREALDAAPYMLRQMLAYKAVRDGAALIVVDPKNTTQECSFCGLLHFKELSDAEHVCTTPGLYFGTTLPRKVNAARVILKRALSQVDEDGGGPVPEGAVLAANGDTGRRRPGNTEGRQLPPGRRPGDGAPSSRAPSPSRARSPTRAPPRTKSP